MQTVKAERLLRVAQEIADATWLAYAQTRPQ